MKKRILYLISAIMLFVGFSCDKNDDVRIKGYEKVEVEWQNCISADQQHIMKLKRVEGQIISKEIDSGNFSLTLIVTSDGEEYIPCDSDFLDENIGAHIIFSGDTYGTDPLALYIYVAEGGFLKPTELWIKK
ncbi:hypothetical protein [Dysgonomonas massiliensis]|uniref:hypothetical protein n=1 Tax=Dysgonomonas massiliensis TaxID=2040292 RepID=UPI000C76515E|nr:hypothetical protein [Dysgonomonas massiliensis]